ncbi:MAG: DUF4859 domain-containing protein [Bacteroidaceae bacterium]|nr:DUF4859 domain-containing protein [Bacteroidaceae bacterium]
MAISASAADFTGQSVQKPAEDYTTVPVVFKLSEVATLMNTDATSLVTALDAWAEAYDPDAQEHEGNMLFLQDGTGTSGLNDAYTATGTNGYAGCFWMNKEGKAVAYADGYWFNDFYWSSAENDSLVFAIGQKPGSLLVSGEYKASFVLSYMGFEASFDITLSIDSDVEPVETSFSKLTIVGEKVDTIEQFPREDYTADSIAIDVTEAITALGCTPEYLINNLSASLYVAQLDNSEESEMPTARGDELTNQVSANGIGWWFAGCTDAEGQDIDEVVRASWSSSCKYFIEGLSLRQNEEEKYILEGILGQYPGNLLEGQSFYNYIYIIFGNKAYSLKCVLNIVKDETQPEPGEVKSLAIAEMEKVGNAEVKFEEFSGGTGSATVNLNEVAALMGETWTADTLILAALADESAENMTLKSTANNGGYWMTTKGVAVAWNSNGYALYIEPTLEDGEVTLTSGHNEGAIKEGDSYTFPMFYITPDSTKYFQLDVTVTIKERDVVDPNNLVEVAVIPIEVATLAGGDYPIEEEPALDMANLEELIGTRAPTFYAWTAPDAEGNQEMTDKYSCTPHPGFWMSSDGYAATWGASNPVGVCYLSNGHFDLYRYPGTPKAGDTWNGKFVLLNSATGQYVTIDLTVKFFETIVKTEVVGEETVSVKGGDETTVDLTAMLTATGMAVADLNDFQVLTAKDASGEWITPVDPYNGVNFKDGVCIEGTDFEQAVSINVDTETTSTIEVVLGEGYTLSGSVNLDIAILYDSKMYIYHLVVCDAETWASVEGIQADSAAKAIYNIAGQRVKKATKGLYIIGNRKVAVK